MVAVGAAAHHVQKQVQLGGCGYVVERHGGSEGLGMPLF
ncbi:Uncharacterised protein [Bordetella pertussis]|nr:Uncharacterised protein [Bordetella pertussis]